MKTKILITLGALLCIAAASVVEKRVELPRAKVTARVVDEQGVPIPGAHVKLVFGKADNANAIITVEGTTGADGLFAGEGYSGGSFGASITKDGYYNSGLAAPKLVDIKDGRWQPWDPLVTAVLRPIGNPVALCAKHVQTHIPVLDQPCGYDLEKGDWVVPHGRGAKADLVFTAHREYRGWMDFSAAATVTFSHPADGIVRMDSPAFATLSQLRWQREAPETGFLALHKIHIADLPSSSGKNFEQSFDTTKRDQGYFFRVRTVEENGRIVAGNYGKIAGDIAIDPRDSKTCSIGFTYYFNPTSLDRNLEWDTTRNLIAGLSFEETPRDP